MRFGYWLPVFGGWLRNIEDEGMDASWEYVRRLARRSEQIGFDLTVAGRPRWLRMASTGSAAVLVDTGEEARPTGAGSGALR